MVAENVINGLSHHHSQPLHATEEMLAVSKLIRLFEDTTVFINIKSSGFSFPVIVHRTLLNFPLELNLNYK